MNFCDAFCSEFLHLQYVQKFVINRLDFDLMKQGNSLRMYIYRRGWDEIFFYFLINFLCK